MALYQRDLVSDINSFNSQIASDIGITTPTGEEATSTISVNSTTSSDPTTTSAKNTSTVKSTASSTTKSTDSASSSPKSAAASTITSSSSITSKSTVTSSSRSFFSSSPSPSGTTHSSTTSTTQTTTITSTSSPSATGTILPTTSTASGNTISSAGLAVAVIFALLILSGILYLLWKYLPAARRYRERAYIARSHRKGLSFSAPRKGLAFTDEESTHDLHLHLDDPKLGLGLRKFDFHAAPTYYPGEPLSYGLDSGVDRDQSQGRPMTSASSESDHVVSPLSTRSTRSKFSHSTLPSALQAGPTRYMPHLHQDIRASQIGVAVPFTGDGSGNGNLRPGSGGKGLPPLPLPSIGYGRPFS